MRVKIRPLILLAAAGVVLFSISCEVPAPASTTSAAPVRPTPGPDLQATTAALAQPAEGRNPTPTPVPPQVKDAALEFARGHRTIIRDWEEFHADFGKWRGTLGSCDASSAQATLSQFAGRFSGISETARGLPRPSVVRGLADQLIAAAEKEEKAVRLLRDTWHPGKPSVFEPVDVARAESAAIQKKMEDQLADQLEAIGPAFLAAVEAFSKASLQLNSSWDKFHQEYDSFRSREADLTGKETVLRLSQLVAQFRDIVVAARELPQGQLTRRVAQGMAKAAEEEDLALRKLRDSFQKTEDAAKDSKSSEAARGAKTTETGEDSPASAKAKPEVTFTTKSPTPYDAFDSQLVASNAARRQARQDLADVQGQGTKEAQAAVAKFAGQYDVLVKALNQFHQDYDAWRRTEGGCDRTKAVEALGGFTLRFGELASRVRALPRAAFLRPMGELLVEAAEREEGGLRSLRNGWRPFDAEVYKPLEQEQNTAGKLRRQVAVGIQDLLERYDISLPGPERPGGTSR